MVSDLANLWISFLAGLFAPLGAVCVLPLYPGFLSYLASQVTDKENKKQIIIFGGSDDEAQDSASDEPQMATPYEDLVDDSQQIISDERGVRLARDDDEDGD